jgi:hypothetical protein
MDRDNPCVKCTKKMNGYLIYENWCEALHRTSFFNFGAQFGLILYTDNSHCFGTHMHANRRSDLTIIEAAVVFG